ncbi:phosphotransferase [Phytomonospora sp. NPDC050363]|uniref:phosphotransferase family protein n=1 Tax=Phytomonospora sp. NPDC050363 TaxID=3155642 RepID=UPI00340B7C20
MTHTRHAVAIATAILGRDPGPMTTVDSASHEVYLGADVVVKLIDAGRHTRMSREIALAPHLPAGLTAPLLDSGVHDAGDRELRYACYARAPGTSPGMGMAETDAATARALAEQAVGGLRVLHAWRPSDEAAGILVEPLDHGGFTGREALLAEVDALAAADREGAVARRLLDGVAAIAAGAPTSAAASVPVHADCHWGNWLADGPKVTALLDFEWARLGEAADDWFFLIRFSGPHRAAVLDVVAGVTAVAPDVLRAACEVREAAYLVADLRAAREEGRAGGERLAELEELVLERSWWRG